jgi:P4 family phage/plasmid primase-like protien
MTLSEAMTGYKVYDTFENEIKLTSEEDYMYNLPRILTIHPANQVITSMKLNLECISKIVLNTARERTAHHENVDVTGSVQLATELMPLIAHWRADNYDDWFEMLCVLYCIGDGCQEALDLAIQFSAKTSRNNFDEAYCMHQWQRLVNTHRYTVGTLRHYASIDSPREYEEWKKKKAQARIKDSLKGGHNDLAKMLHDCYASVFVCAGLEKNIWFEFKNHKWKKIEKGITLRQKITDDLVKRFQEEVSRVYIDLSDEGTNTVLQQKIKQLDKIIGNLKSAPFKNNVMVEACEEFYNGDFLEKMDADVNLLGFENGVFDVRIMAFRDGKPEDYVSMSTGYDYKDFTDDDPAVLDVKDFLIKVFPDPLLRRYFLEYCAQLLKGGNFRKIFLNHTGAGDNGKSVTIELIEQTLGKYSIKFPTSLLVGKRTQSSQAAPELARAYGVRHAIVQEPSNKDVINEGILKELTGNDSFFNRGLFKDGGELKTQLKLAMVCNKLPRLEGNDPAIWARMDVLPYESWFPKDSSQVPKTFEEQLAKKIFHRDPNFNEKLPHMRQAFMWLLIQVFKEIAVKGPSDKPLKVLEATAIYQRNNDVFLQFVTEGIISDPAKKMSLSEVYIAFQQWFRDSFPNLKIPPKNDLRDDLIKRWGPPSTSLHWAGVRVRTVRDDVAENKAILLTDADLDKSQPKSTTNEDRENGSKNSVSPSPSPTSKHGLNNSQANNIVEEYIDAADECFDEDEYAAPSHQRMLPVH